MPKRGMRLKPVLGYEELVKDYVGESDRAAGVLCFAYLERQLSLFLRSCLVAGKVVDGMFDPGGTFGSLKRVMDGLQALGLLVAEERTTIQTLANIRNEFAHSPSGCTFAGREVAACLEQIDPSHSYPDPRLCYYMEITMLAGRLQRRRDGFVAGDRGMGQH